MRYNKYIYGRHHRNVIDQLLKLIQVTSYVDVKSPQEAEPILTAAINPIRKRIQFLRVLRTRQHNVDPLIRSVALI